MNADLHERLRKLPKVDTLLADSACVALVSAHGRALVVDALRSAMDAARDRVLADPGNGVPTTDEILADAKVRLAVTANPSLRGVVNVTGIVLHTNLGRAPLCAEALRAMTDVGEGYSTLEYDVAKGARGSRQSHVDSLLCRLTGAEAALIVNNNAAAVMLAVNTVARDGEVITSRGELIEIGGSFRIPDVIETSDARLVETGTTNRTRAADFARAITPSTRALLKVHPSNYRIVGFTESPSRAELVALAHDRGLVAIEDLGSGTLVDLTQFGLPGEPTVQDAVRAGMDIVTFSGDKLLGGPQAGVAVGRADLVARMKQNPLYRALRVDKATIAALEATLRVYLDPDRATERLPVLRMLSMDMKRLEARAQQLAASLASHAEFEVSVCASESFAGGGSLPEESLPDFAVAVRSRHRSPDALHAVLRQGDPPVIARIADGVLLLHMRTVEDRDLPRIEAAFAQLAI